MSAANFQIGYTAAIAALYGNEDFNTMHAIFEKDYSDGWLWRKEWQFFPEKSAEAAKFTVLENELQETFAPHEIPTTTTYPIIGYI